MIFSNKLIIFDCDGVLIDSEIIAARIESELAIGLGFEITPQEICARFAGRPARLVWEAVFGELGHELINLMQMVRVDLCGWQEEARRKYNIFKGF